MGEGYPTSGLAVLRYAGDWPDLSAGDCELERFHVCRGLVRASDAICGGVLLL